MGRCNIHLCLQNKYKENSNIFTSLHTLLYDSYQFIHYSGLYPMQWSTSHTIQNINHRDSVWTIIRSLHSRIHLIHFQVSIKKTKSLPVSQHSPVKPGGHSQQKPLTLSSQLPPFKHGSLQHSLISAKQTKQKSNTQSFTSF